MTMATPESKTGSGFSPAEIRARLQTLAATRPSSIRLGVPLRELTTIRIGGPAFGLASILTLEDAKWFQGLVNENEVPVACLGSGSNVLADDRGFCGLIMRMERATFEVSGDAVTAGAGLPFDALIERCLGTGLTGLEFASGIPGTVGGAVVGNAGCFGHEIGEFLIQATLLKADGTVASVGPAELAFGYRSSSLKGSQDILLDVCLQLRRGDLAAAADLRHQRLAQRWQKHPRQEPSAGSYFKNLPPLVPGGPRRAAGELLEQVGAKQMRVGGAAVFARHANIIINTGTATCRDVLALAKRMKQAVFAAFGVQLQEEVRYLPWQAAAEPPPPAPLPPGP
jgi:UDP-N-acetylmuramate dehydrogenase